MGSQGFIEPPPGLFGETPSQRGEPGAPADVPASPPAFVAHPAPSAQPAQAPAAPSVQAPQPAPDVQQAPAPQQVPAAPRFTIRADSPAAQLPGLPRLAAPDDAAGPNASPAPTPNASPVPAADDVTIARDPWPTAPAYDLVEGELPAFPRLTPPAPGFDGGVAPEAPGRAPTPAVAGAPTPTVVPGGADAPRDDRSLPEWSLVLADGVAIPLYGPVIVGRKPSSERFPGATLAAVPDTTRTMSKTHARFYLDEGVPMVDDLGSTNGIALFPGGNTQGAMAVEPGSPAEVRSGDVVQLGEYEISVHRN